ncbi:MAG TPA: hypothetical protein DD671_09125, partial [Balneolaceae bacterium]|nr:hypothetical protein [Balneolaceae bacterium]
NIAMVIPEKTGIQLLPKHTLVLANHSAPTEQSHFIKSIPQSPFANLKSSILRSKIKDWRSYITDSSDH